MFSVRRSKIHGRGCFTEYDLLADEVFVVPHYEVAVDDEDSPHNVWVDDTPYRFYHPFMFLNHSKKPNAELCFEEDGFRLYILKKIPKGGELTIDYGEDWD